MKRLHEEYPCFVPTALPMFRPYGTRESSGVIGCYPYFVPTATHISSLAGLGNHLGDCPVLPIFRPYGTRAGFESVGNKKRNDNQIAPKIIIVH